MEEIQSEKHTDVNIEYDILNEAIETFKKTLTQTTSSPKNNIIKNSVFNKLKFFDLVLIDNNSNFLDLKIKLELNPNKNAKNQVFVKDNVIHFTNFSELTTNILSKINKDLNAYTISYFKDNLEKINSNIDIYNYQGQAVFVKVCEKFNKRTHNLSNSNMSVYQIKSIANWNSPKNNNASNLNNYNKRKIILKSESKELNDVERDIAAKATDGEASVLKTLNDLNSQQLQKREVQEKNLNLNKIIEENLKFNLQIRNKKNANLLPKLNSELSKHKSSNFDSASAYKSENKDKDPNCPENGIPRRENNHRTSDAKDAAIVKGEKPKQSLNEIVPKRNILIKNKIELMKENSENKPKTGIETFHKKENRIILLPNVHSKKLSNKETYEDFIKIENQEHQENQEKYESLIFPAAAAVEKNTYLIDSSALSPGKIRRGLKDSFISKKFGEPESKFKTFYCEKKSVSLIKLNKKLSYKQKKESLRNSIKALNEAELKENKTANNLNEINNNNNPIENDLTTPYLITNESYSDNQIKPKIQLNLSKKQNENTSNLSSNNFHSFGNNSNLINSSNFSLLKLKGLSKDASLDSKKNVDVQKEKEFFVKKIKLNNNIDDFFQVNKQKNIVMNNATINIVLAKGSRKKLLASKDKNDHNDHMDDKGFASLNRTNPNFFKTHQAQNKFKNRLFNLNSNSYSKYNWMGVAKDKNFDSSRYNSSNNFYVVNNSNELSKHNSSNSPKNSYLINSTNSIQHNYNPFFAKENYSVINNNSLMFSNHEKYSIFSKTFNKGRKVQKLHKNRGLKAINSKTYINSTNNESYVPSLVHNKSKKNLFNIVTNTTESETETESKFFKDHQKEIKLDYKLKGIKDFLGIEEPALDLDKTFNRFLENVENSEAENFYFLNLFHSKKFGFKNSEKNNNQYIDNPTINNKVYSVDKINVNNINNKTDSNSHLNKMRLLKDTSGLQKKNEIFNEKLSKNFNKSAGKFQDLHCIRSKDKCKKNKNTPHLDKITYEEVKATKAIIKQFIENYLGDFISNTFIENNLREILLNKGTEEKENKTYLNLQNLDAKKQENINILVKDNNKDESKGILPANNSKACLLDANKSSENSEPQQNFLNEEDCEFAKEFIFLSYLNSVALEKFFFKNLNKEDELNNTSYYFFNFNNSNANNNLSPNPEEPNLNTNSWYDASNRNLALQFFNTSNNSKQISNFNALVRQSIEKLKKDPSPFNKFINFIILNNANLFKNCFALDLIFANTYLVDPKNKSIDEKIVYLLVEYLASEKEKKIYFDNYKHLKSLPEFKEVESEVNSNEKFNAKFVFLKDFLRMLINNSEENIALIIKSFEITEDEICFILSSSAKGFKKYVDDESFRKKINRIFATLIKTLL